MTKKEQRQSLLLQMISAQEMLPIRTLASRLAVSEMTVRRDFAKLESEGRLKRVQGAATSLAGLDGAGLRRLLAQADAQAGPGLGLVTGLRWYCALLTDEPAEPGSRLSLRLDGEEFAARVESSGEGVLLLSGTEGMAELAGIRRAQAEIELP